MKFSKEKELATLCPLPYPQLQSHVSNTNCSQEGHTQQPALVDLLGLVPQWQGPPPGTKPAHIQHCARQMKANTAAANIISALHLSPHSQKKKLSNLGPSSMSCQIREGHLGHLHKNIPPEINSKLSSATRGSHEYALVVLSPLSPACMAQ